MERRFEIYVKADLVVTFLHSFSHPSLAKLTDREREAMLIAIQAVTAKPVRLVEYIDGEMAYIRETPDWEGVELCLPE